MQHHPSVHYPCRLLHVLTCRVLHACDWVCKHGPPRGLLHAGSACM